MKKILLLFLCIGTMQLDAVPKLLKKFLRTISRRSRQQQNTPQEKKAIPPGERKLLDGQPLPLQTKYGLFVMGPR